MKARVAVDLESTKVSRTGNPATHELEELVKNVFEHFVVGVEQDMVQDVFALSVLLEED